MNAKNINVDQQKTELATLAGGCFWCTESVFLRVRGVISVLPGYTGGNTKNPTYEKVCMGHTGHAEAIQITFNPHIISYEKLLEIFFHVHDPTTLNQQDYDKGTQYRSAIFYHSENQKSIAKKGKSRLEKKGLYKGKFVTEIVKFKKFYPAEENHRDYYAKNSYTSYCQYIIDPKINKLLEKFPKDVK